MNYKRIIGYVMAGALCFGMLTGIIMSFTANALNNDTDDGILLSGGNKKDLMKIIRSHIHFTSDMIEPLKTIRNSSEAIDKRPGMMGQWGDSNTHTAVYIITWYDTSSNHIAYTGFNYGTILSWLGGGVSNMPREGYKDSPYNGSGWTTNNILSNAQNAINAQKPSWMHLKIGTNDAAGSALINAAAYETRMRSILDITIANGVIPTLSTSLCRENTGARIDRLMEFNTVIRKLSTEYKIPYVDLEGLFRELYPNGEWNELLFNDALHYSYSPPTTGGNYGAAMKNEADLRMNGYALRNILTAELALLLKAQVFDAASGTTVVQ